MHRAVEELHAWGFHGHPVQLVQRLGRRWMLGALQSARLTETGDSPSNDIRLTVTGDCPSYNVRVDFCSCIHLRELMCAIWK